MTYFGKKINGNGKKVFNIDFTKIFHVNNKTYFSFKSFFILKYALKSYFIFSLLYLRSNTKV